MRFSLFFFFALTLGQAWTQVSEKYNSPYAAFYRAEDLFEKEQYSAARKEFRLFVDGFSGSKNDPFYIKSLYYEGLSALELYNNDAVSLLEKFNQDYPESIYRYDVYLRVGRYYYQKKDYKKTIQWLAQLDKQKVESIYHDEYFFKLGYAYFHEKQFPESKVAFFEIKDVTSQYGSPALYYYSHICYIDGSYQTALEGFQRLLVDARFKQVVPYYIAQIYYMQGDFAQVINFSAADLDSLKPGEQLEMNRLIGDAFFKLNKFDEAVPFLEKYNLKAVATRDDEYQLAYSYFKSSNYQKAVKYFDKVARKKDTLGQIALYHAGECYMNLNELVYARTAFDAASQLDMDELIQEDALYNFAIISYKLDLNPYDEAVLALEKYLTKYPDSPRKTTVYQYLINVYTTTRNYVKALESLDRLPTKDNKLKSAYQSIAFNRGVELYQKSEYLQAIDAFKLIERYPMNQDVSAKGVFWTGEAHHQLKNYMQAIQSYRGFLAMPSTYLTGLRADAYYAIGYCFLELKDVPQTMEAFRSYLAQPSITDKRKKADATMRLADVYYITKLNLEAIATYKQAYDLKSGYEDQALFYMARVYGFEKNRELKIQNLLDIINNYPNSKYTLTAIFEVGLSYYNGGMNDKALRYFEQVVRDYPTSIQVKDALHYIGDIYFKQGEFIKAESFFKRVLTEYGNDKQTCIREVTGLADIYKKQGNLGKVEQLPNLYPCADSIRFEVEDSYFEKGLTAYEDSLFQQSIADFDTYLGKYPTGKYRVEVLNYKADALYETDKESDAVAIYRTTLEGQNDDFTETAAQRTAKFLYNAKKYDEALPYYQRLEQVAKKPELIQSARLGLMRCHFILENYSNASDYAKKVLSNSQLTNSVKLEAQFANGISLAKTDRFSESLPFLEYVVKNTTTIIGAEAKYTIAAGYFSAKEPVKSESEIRGLLKMKPGYDFWIAKSLILQTKILIGKDDLFQAENTIKSVVENYTNKDDGVLTEAGELYDEIMQMKNQPKNSAPQEGTGTVIEFEENPDKQ